MFSTILRDEGLLARAIRSAGWTMFGFGFGQAIRFASNLVLTRLLFPEDFGLMALVTVALVGLGTFSDMGTSPAIQYNARGDDPDFLDTAWTLHVIRGVALWIATCALALPFSRFYEAPELALMLPVAGLSFLLGGFLPTRIETAQRHLAFGKVVQMELAAQIVSVAVMIALAWWTGSVWSLVLSGVVHTCAKLALVQGLMPGRRNRFRLEPEARGDLIGFGKWIFLSTVCGFVVMQGDKAILGKFLSLDSLGIYNVGYFLAGFPLLLAQAVTGRVLIPIYRDRPPAGSPENFRTLRKMRVALSGGTVSLLVVMMFAGVPLVHLLYDPRFAAAGPIVVLVAFGMIPTMISLSYEQAALAAGDSRRFFFMMAPRAAIVAGALLIGANHSGLVGALVGQAIGAVLVYPFIVALARRYGAWDPLHDAFFAVVAVGFGGVALWLSRDAIAALATLG